MRRWFRLWQSRNRHFVHLDTDPACREYRPTRPGSRLDRVSRGIPCLLCARSDRVEYAWITCPRCHRTSYHPQDIKEGYCGACHDWTTPRPTVS